MIYILLAIILLLLVLSSLWRWLCCSSLSKEDVLLYQSLLKSQIKNNEWSYAEETLAILIKDDNANLNTMFLQVVLLREMGKVKEAENIIQNVLDNNRDNLLFLKELGRIYLSQKCADEALKIFQVCKSLIKKEDEVLDLATELFCCNMIEECWSLLKDIIENSKNGRLYALVGDCHFYWEKFDEALDFYLTAEQYNWVNHQILSRIGACYQQQERWEVAQQYFKTILKKDTSDVSVVLGMGMCLEAQNKYHKALILYQNVEAWKDENVYLLCQAGTCAARLCQYNLALSYLNRALVKNFVSPQLLVFLGYSYECLGEWRRSEEIYFKLLKVYPNHSSGYLSLAWLYGVGLTRSLSAEEGVAMAKKALRFQANERGWEILSSCEARAGNFERAHNILERLAGNAKTKESRRHYQHSMRNVRKKIPLDHTFIKPVKVA